VTHRWSEVDSNPRSHGDDGGAATWRRITVGELANTTPPGPAIVPHNYLYDGA